MGCASSRLGPTVTHVPETIPHRVRRRIDSIRRRRRVADSFINAKETSTSLSKKLLLETDSDKLGSSPNSSRDLDREKMNVLASVEESVFGDDNDAVALERDRADCIDEAVKRAIDDVMLEEEGEEEEEDDDDGGRRVDARGKEEDGERVCIGSPSFRVYCVEPKPFGSFASIDYEVKSVEEDHFPKAHHESSDSQPTPVPDKEGSISSSSSSSRGRRSGGRREKISSICRNKGSLGMKRLLNMSCYSCAADDRTRIVHS